MAGLVIDTANFQHPNTTPRTLRVASELLAAGAELPTIARRIYRTKPNAQLRLFGRVLARLETSADGRLVWSVLVGRRHRGAPGPRPRCPRGSSTCWPSRRAPRSSSSSRTSASARASPCARAMVASTPRRSTGVFGGGGHARAAGATIELPLAEARPTVLELAGQLVAALPAR